MPPISKNPKGLLLAGFLFLCLVLAFLLLRPKPQGLPPLPQPNGFDDLKLIASKIPRPRDHAAQNGWPGDSTLGGPDQWPTQLLESYVKACQPAVNQLQLSLKKEWLMPHDRLASTTRLMDMATIQVLLRAAFRSSWSQEFLEPSLQTALNELQLGQLLQQGADSLFWFMGSKQIELGLRHLQELAPKLSPDAAGALLQDLNQRILPAPPIEAMRIEELLFQEMNLKDKADAKFWSMYWQRSWTPDAKLLKQLQSKESEIHTMVQELQRTLETRLDQNPESRAP